MLATLKRLNLEDIGNFIVLLLCNLFTLLICFRSLELTKSRKARKNTTLYVTDFLRSPSSRNIRSLNRTGKSQERKNSLNNYDPDELLSSTVLLNQHGSITQRKKPVEPPKSKFAIFRNILVKNSLREHKNLTKHDTFNNDDNFMINIARF